MGPVGPQVGGYDSYKLQGVCGVGGKRDRKIAGIG